MKMVDVSRGRQTRAESPTGSSDADLGSGRTSVYEETANLTGWRPQQLIGPALHLGRWGCGLAHGKSGDNTENTGVQRQSSMSHVHRLTALHHAGPFAFYSCRSRRAGGREADSGGST